MPTTPEQVRAGLQAVTAASVAEIRVVAEQSQGPGQRGALFAATPLIVSAFTEGSSALALDWYEELRDLAQLSKPFTPTIVAPLREEYLTTAIAWATEELHGLTAQMEVDAEALTQEILTRLEPVVQKEVAAGFWNTITENAANDPDAVGWRRHARGDGCPFCRFLADKGAIYKADTVNFAAHTNCHCTVSPVFNGEDGPEADVMQYVASQRKRTPAERKRVREYLEKKYGTTSNTSSSSPKRIPKPSKPSLPIDVDADRTIAQLRETLAALEKSVAKFDSPGTRKRIADLRRKIAARGN